MLANNIKKQREEKQLSLSELGKLAKVSKSIIFCIENGETKSPRIDVVFRLAKALNISVNELVYGEKRKLDSKLYSEVRLNENIKKIRKRKGLTTIDLGNLVGINSGNINYIESGKTKYPRVNLVCKISKVLEVQLDELIYEYYQ